MPSQGDIVLIPVPFTNLSSSHVSAATLERIRTVLHDLMSRKP
jgi:hypothetical protein